MTVFSRKHKFIFLHVPKNGGTSIRSSIGKIEKIDDFDKQVRKERDPVYANHFPFWKIQELSKKNPGLLPDFSDYMLIMVIRNPWERMVSLYLHRKRKFNFTTEGTPRNSTDDISVIESGFNNWILNTKNKSDIVLTRTNQISWIRGINSNQKIKILRFENLEKDFQRVFSFIDHSRLKKINNSPEKYNYKNFYGHEAKNHVSNFFSLDIKIGKYEF